MKQMLQKIARSVSAIRPSRHIMVKIWLSTAAVVLAFILLIMIGAQFFFNHFYLDSALDRTKKSVHSTAVATSTSINNIILRFVSVCGTTNFRDLMFRIRAAGKAEFTELNNDLQDTLYNLSTCDALVISAVITSQQNLRYVLLSQQLTNGAAGYTLGCDPADIQGLSFLPVCDSPIRGKNKVIPLAIPLSFLGGDSLLTIAPDVASSNAILFLLLDAEAFNKMLAQYGEGKYNTAYLLNGTGNVLNVSAAGDALRLAMQQDDFRLPQADAEAPEETQLYSLLFASGASVLIVFLITLFSAIFLSAPLRKLTGVVKTISDGTYTSASLLRQRDEIGQLSEAIDTMYHTIQNQIEQIYEERRAKYNAEVRLFTEQINPHFLYNTLEFINLEVYNGHTENAALMIQSLGSFMRIGLSFGRERIPLEKELQHVQAYITIVNHRFSHNICFTTDIPDTLHTRLVPKIILQPLVENSIRHGFLLEDHRSFLETPSIRVKCQRVNEMLVLSIIDNGMGFDAKAITETMHRSPDPQAHIGLNNVFTRLRLLYGDQTDITFQSIPYYRNTVSITIPYRCTAEGDAGQTPGKPV